MRRYVEENPQIDSVLITGGDPMIMKTKFLRQYIEPLMNIPHLNSIRVGTKAIAYWPYRFTEGEDADDLLRLIGEVRKAGKNFAVMAHSSHPVEFSTEVSQLAVKRLIDAGAVVRCQAPLIKRVNDHPDIWAALWRKQVALGAVILVLRVPVPLPMPFVESPQRKTRRCSFRTGSRIGTVSVAIR